MSKKVRAILSACALICLLAASQLAIGGGARYTLDYTSGKAIADSAGAAVDTLGTLFFHAIPESSKCASLADTMRFWVACDSTLVYTVQVSNDSLHWMDSFTDTAQAGIVDNHPVPMYPQGWYYRAILDTTRTKATTTWAKIYVVYEF